MRRQPLRILAAIAILAAPTWGCGEKSDRPATVPVQGKVTYKGEPVTKGTVTFQAADGQTATGEIQPDGTYRLSTFADGDGALPGQHKVMIIANDGDPTLMPGSSPGYKEPKELVPTKYQSLETSGLTADVAEGKSAIDFDLN